MIEKHKTKLSLYDCRILIVLAFLFGTAVLQANDSCEKEIPVVEEMDSSLLTLERIYTDEDFESESFGPARWLESGEGYTTLEESIGCEDANDIVKYDPATSDSQVVISANDLIPDGMERPLVIEDYSWSDDGTKLLIFTNTKKVWRKETRGDYWV